MLIATVNNLKCVDVGPRRVASQHNLLAPLAPPSDYFFLGKFFAQVIMLKSVFFIGFHKIEIV